MKKNLPSDKKSDGFFIFKLLWRLRAFFLFAAPSSLVALPVGNPKEADLFYNGLWFGQTPSCCNICDPCFILCNASSVRGGFYGHYVFDRDLKVEHADVTDGENKTIDTAKIFTNALYLACNFCNRADLFATAGITDMRLRQDARLFGSPISFKSKLEFSRSFSWSVGARATLWEIGRIAMGTEGQFFMTSNYLDHFVNRNDGNVTDFHGSNSLYWEWQAGLGLSYHMCSQCNGFGIIPYAAIKYSKARLHIHRKEFVSSILGVPTTLRLRDMHSHKPWGCALGISMTWGSLTGITFEGNLGDEKALYLNAQMRF